MADDIEWARILAMAYHVSKEQFARLVEAALRGVPEPFASHLEEVAVEVRDAPTADDVARAGVRRGDLLLGLYTGRPRTHRSVLDGPSLPDVIQIFQRHIELVSKNEQELVEQVRTTVLHEIGHHFGMSENDLDELGYG
jgi:predicted Zn-dependent protease with MMP-like domain